MLYFTVAVSSKVRLLGKEYIRETTKEGKVLKLQLFHEQEAHEVG